jgi:hypothetical protein
MNRSSICQEGGTYPRWKDALYFTVTNDPILKVEVWDDDSCLDDIVGTGNYNLEPHLNQRLDTTGTH